MWFTSWLFFSVSAFGDLYESWNQFRSAELPEQAAGGLPPAELERPLRLEPAARDEKGNGVGGVGLDVTGRRMVGGDGDDIVGQPQRLDQRTEIEAVDRLNAGGFTFRIAVVPEEVGALQVDVETAVLL